MIGSIMDTTLPEQEGMYEKWPGLKRIIKMELKCTGNGVRSRETIYYLSSMEKDEVSVLLCETYPSTLGHREQTAPASRRDFPGGYVPCSRQKRCRQFLRHAQVCIGN